MIIAAHTVIFAEDADRARAFFRDVLGLPNVDAGGGWLIFRAPPGIPVRHGAGKEQMDAAPRCLGRRPDRTSDRVTRRAQCAVSLGLGVKHTRIVS